MSSPSSTSSTSSTSSASSASPRIQALIVDSDDDRRLRLVQSLGRRGWSTVTALGGEDLSLPLKQIAFDVVMIQLRLHDGNGIDLLPAVRRCNETVPVVIWFQPTCLAGQLEPRSIWFLRGTSAPPLVPTVERSYRDFVRREGRRLERQETMPLERGP